MKQTAPLNPADFIVPLNMNSLRGRMLRMPAPANHKREILFIYGHHSTIERWWGLIQVLNDYGAVTVPDLPGFGGMESFYRIQERPTLDNYADYMAAFVKLRYKGRRFTIVGLSFGFLVATRMLQKYPDLAKKVDLVLSVAGFSHYQDLTFTKPRYLFYKYSAALFSHHLPAIVFRNIALHPQVIRAIYGKTNNAKHKFKDAADDAARELMDFEVHLWRNNDLRTYMATSVLLLTVNNCNKQVDLPVWHIGVKTDQYFDNKIVEQHMRVIFTDFHMVLANLDKHAPSIMADKKAAAALIPGKIRRLLNKD